MKPIKDFIDKNFELFFVGTVILGAVFISTFVTYKLAFLNIYFIPVLMAAYYLDLRKALWGGLACILITVAYVRLYPDSFIPGTAMIDIYMNIFTWGCFLLLTGIVVGLLNQKLKNEMEQTRRLNSELTASKASLVEAGKEIQDHALNLEKKVVERTESLEKSKGAVEDLKKKVEDALYSTMDSSVVKMIIEGRLRTEKRRVSILFADLKGFTRYSEDRRPEMVITDLNKFLEGMEDVLVDFKAHIDKYVGDGIMVEFGAPMDYQRHALLAVMAGIKMQQKILKGGFPLQMRVGIATGEPIIGLIGHRKKTYTAIGDVVNLASRIQELCTPGEVALDADTYEEVQRFINCRRKAVQQASATLDPEVAARLEETLQRFQESPKDAVLAKRAAFLYLDANDVAHAHQLLRKAMELDPADDRVKVAFAETTMKVSQLEDIAIRGKEKRLHLYEVTGIKNPLLDREKIPLKLHETYAETVSRLVEYPEEIVLPVESLDGSIGHSRVVGFLAYAIADVLDLPDQEKKDILQAGYLADIGKAIISHHLLNRSGSLTKTEFAEVVKHPRESVRVLRKMGYEGQGLFEIIEAHHECPNGSGYPEGLRGDKVPLGARIVAVADNYDAITSWRPYRDRWDYRAAYSEMCKDGEKGKFDAKVLSTLGRLLGLGA